MSDMPARLLREALREHAAPASSSECLDAETLAAWSDGALSARNRTAAESHAAGCARCQAMLAAMTRIAPPPPARSWWRAPGYKWLVPLAAAAAAVVLWIAVPRPRLDRQTTVARVSLPSTAPAPRTESRGADASNAQRAIDRVEPLPSTAPPPEEKADTRGARGAAAATRGRSQSAQTAATGQTPLRDAAGAAPQLPSTSPIGVDAFALAAAPALPPAAPSQPPANPQASADAAAPIAPSQETIAVAPNVTESVRVQRDRAAAAPAQARAKIAAPIAEIVSPDRNVRWRVRTAGIVERSIDGGATWQIQSTGVRTPLVSGAAPSAKICWLVGAGGTVLRSIDGATWQRVPFPEAIDLTSVLASDAANATILGADGRTFTTRDGGRTWQSR
jgi:hypothetical protein